MVEVDSFQLRAFRPRTPRPKKLSPQGVCTPGWELLFGGARLVKITRISVSCQ